jgi:hypothetical protein
MWSGPRSVMLVGAPRMPHLDLTRHNGVQYWAMNDDELWDNDIGVKCGVSYLD